MQGGPSGSQQLECQLTGAKLLRPESGRKGKDRSRGAEEAARTTGGRGRWRILSMGVKSGAEGFVVGCAGLLRP